MSATIIPQKLATVDQNIDLDALMAPDPAPAPAPMPTPDAPKADWAAWYHRVGYKIAEMTAEDSKRRYGTGDDCIRSSAVTIQMAWDARPDANIALRLGFQRDTTAIGCLDTDGLKALRFVEPLLPSNTPKCTHPSGDGAKFIVRMPPSWDGKSARLIVPGCTNKGHDGLELLGIGKTATVAPSTHRNGDRYVWDVPLPDDPAKIPLCPDAILNLERVTNNIKKSDLAEDLLIRQSGTNREMTVADWREWMEAEGKDKVSSIHSPFRTDLKPSCWLTLFNGSLYLHDAATGESIRDGLFTERSGNRKQSRIKTDRITVPFGNRIRVHRQYLGIGKDNPLIDPVVFAAQMVAVKQAVGGGKSISSADYIKALETYLERKPKVLSIGYRQSLVSHNVKTFDLEADYREVNWSSDSVDSLGITLDSVCSYGGRGKLASRLTSVVVTDQDGNGVGIPEIISQEWDAVILDEAESVIEHAHGGTVKDRSRDVYGVLTNIVRAHTRQTILIDAHLSDYSINEYSSMMGSDYDPNRCVLVENTWKRGQNAVEHTFWTGAKPGDDAELYRTKRITTAPRLIRVPTPEDLEHRINEALELGKSAYVACTSVKEVRRLALNLGRKYPAKHIITVTGEHDDPEGEKFLRDPNGYMDKHRIDAAICSPAVESGVSIDRPFDVAFLLASRGAAQTWQDLVQMVGRPRNLTYRWIFAYVAEHGPAKWLNEAEYKQALIDGRDDIYMMFREHIDPNGKLIRVPMDEEHLDSHVRTVVHINRSRVNLAKDFWDYWVEQGCEVIDLSDHPDELMDDDERKKLKNEKRADKLEIKEADAKATAEAKNDGMTVSEARKILDRDSKPEDKRKARKTLIEDFYGRDATTELVLTDNEGKFRQQIRRFNTVRMVATQGEDGIKKVLTAKDQISFEAGVTATQRTETVRAMIAWELLQAAGVTADNLDGNKAVFPGQVDLDNTTTYLQNSSVERRLKHLFGLNVQNYLKPGKRKNGTGVSLTKTKPTPVPLDKDETFHDPSLESMTDDEFDALATKAAEALKAQQKPAQPMKLIRDVARQIGLTFRFKQIRSGPNRGQREYRLKMETVDRMLDYGKNDWKRLDSTTIPGQLVEDEAIEGILEFLAG